jgi:hypothetical protein
MSSTDCHQVEHAVCRESGNAFKIFIEEFSVKKLLLRSRCAEEENAK